MKNAPTTDQSNQSAPQYNTTDQALKNMILDLLRVNDSRMPCTRLLGQLTHDGFTQARVMKALDVLAEQGRIAFESRAYQSKPYSIVRMIVVGVQV